MSEPMPQDYKDAVNGTGPLAHEWADKPHRLVYDLVAALTAATKRAEFWNNAHRADLMEADVKHRELRERAESAEAKSRDVAYWHEAWKEAEAERDALRKDAARLREAIDIFISFQGSTREPEGQAALDAALAVQPTTSTEIHA